MTTRVRNNLLHAGPTVTWLRTSTGIVQPVSTVYSGQRAIGTYQDITGEYGGRFSPGILRLNPVTIRKASGHCTSGHIVIQGLGGNAAFYTDINGPYLATAGSPGIEYGAWDTNLASYSKSGVHSKLNAADAELGLFLVDLHKTVDMIKNPAKELVNLIIDISKGKPKLVSVGDFLADSWLKYKYGILPLIKDIEDLARVYEKQVDSLTNVLSRKRSSARKMSSTASPQPGVQGFASFPLTIVRDVEVKSTSILYYQLVLEANMRRRAKTLGIDISQLPRVAWDTIPLSFVVDWFANIGSWLSAISPSSHVQIRGGCTSQKISIKTSYSHGTVKPNFADPSLYRVLTAQPASFSYESETLIRTLDATVPFTPALKPGALDTHKLLSSAALIWQRLPNIWRAK